MEKYEFEIDEDKNHIIVTDVFNNNPPQLIPIELVDELVQWVKINF